MILKAAIADRVGVGEEADEIVVGQVEVEAAGIGADLVATGAEQFVERQVSAWRRDPRRDLQGLVERQGEGPLIAAARPVTWCASRGVLAFDARPDFGFKDAVDLGLVGQRVEQA